MQVAFKKCMTKEFPWFDGWFGFFITLNNWRRGQFNDFSHAELVFDTLPGESFSCIESDTDDKGNKISGCRFKQIGYSNPSSWVFLLYDYRSKIWPKQYKSEREIREFAKTMEGAKYDWLGITGQGVRNDEIQDSKKFFCSEGVAYVMGIEGHPSPAKLYEIMVKRLKEGVNNGKK